MDSKDLNPDCDSIQKGAEPSAPVPRLLTPDEVAAWLGVRPRTILEWVREGNPCLPPPLELGGQGRPIYRWSEPALIAHINEREDAARSRRKAARAPSRTHDRSGNGSPGP